MVTSELEAPYDVLLSQIVVEPKLTGLRDAGQRRTAKLGDLGRVGSGEGGNEAGASWAYHGGFQWSVSEQLVRVHE